MGNQAETSGSRHQSMVLSEMTVSDRRRGSRSFFVKMSRMSTVSMSYYIWNGRLLLNILQMKTSWIAVDTPGCVSIRVYSWSSWLLRYWPKNKN